MAGQRECRQSQPRRPPFGPAYERRQGRPGHIHPGCIEQFPGLRNCELKVARPQLGQLARQPQPVEAEPDVMARSQHEPESWRSPQDQQLQLPARLLGRQLVQVVHHEPQPLSQRREIAQQPLDDHPAVKIRRRSQRLHKRRARIRAT